MPERHTRETLEDRAAHDSGVFTVSYQGPGDPDELTPRLQALMGRLRRLQAEDGVSLSNVRLIEIVSDLPEAVRYWQRQLGEPEDGVTTLDAAEGMVAGKTFSWGGPDVESIHAVLVLSAGFLDQAANGDTSGTVLLVHELGHVADYLNRRRLGLSDRGTSFKLADVRGLAEALASIIWAEAVANAYAFRYVDDDLWEGDLESWGTMLRGRTVAAEAALQRWDHGEGVTDVWKAVLDEASVLLPQLGRMIGFAALDGAFARRLREFTVVIAPHWGPVIDVALADFDALLETAYGGWDHDRSYELVSVVREAFFALGLHLRPDDGRWGLSLRPRWGPD